VSVALTTFRLCNTTSNLWTHRTSSGKVSDLPCSCRWGSLVYSLNVPRPSTSHDLRHLQAAAQHNSGEQQMQVAGVTTIHHSRARMSSAETATNSTPSRPYDLQHPLDPAWPSHSVQTLYSSSSSARGASQRRPGRRTLQQKLLLPEIRAQAHSRMLR
jgi:hypothetical protein